MASGISRTPHTVQSSAGRESKGTGSGQLLLPLRVAPVLLRIANEVSTGALICGLNLSAPLENRRDRRLSYRLLLAADAGRRSCTVPCRRVRDP